MSYLNKDEQNLINIFAKRYDRDIVNSVLNRNNKKVQAEIDSSMALVSLLLIDTDDTNIINEIYDNLDKYLINEHQPCISSAYSIGSNDLFKYGQRKTSIDIDDNYNIIRKKNTIQDKLTDNIYKHLYKALTCSPAARQVKIDRLYKYFVNGIYNLKLGSFKLKDDCFILLFLRLLLVFNIDTDSHLNDAKYNEVFSVHTFLSDSLVLQSLYVIYSSVFNDENKANDTSITEINRLLKFIISINDLTTPCNKNMISSLLIRYIQFLDTSNINTLADITEMNDDCRNALLKLPNTKQIFNIIDSVNIIDDTIAEYGLVIRSLDNTSTYSDIISIGLLIRAIISVLTYTYNNTGILDDDNELNNFLTWFEIYVVFSSKSNVTVAKHRYDKLISTFLYHNRHSLSTKSDSKTDVYRACDILYEITRILMENRDISDVVNIILFSTTDEHGNISSMNVELLLGNKPRDVLSELAVRFDGTYISYAIYTYLKNTE